jgi:hypothetical protein
MTQRSTEGDPQLELLDGGAGRSDGTRQGGNRRQTPSAARAAVRRRSPPRFGPQEELFPRALSVAELDPRERLGARTAVRRLFRVQWDDERRPHLVFVDRHGTYCEEHGPDCPAVRAVAER